ncbi:PAS domain S-box protein [Halarcobacter sp.]|uniref:PAS domain S-box protein n=1 Tax=Halarcobacter sp. TaxID=2321133 RepID=UPI003A8FCFAD
MNIFNTKTKIIFVVSITISLFLYLFAYTQTKEIIEKSFSDLIVTKQDNIKFLVDEFDKSKFDLLNTLVNEKSMASFFSSKNNTDIKNLFLTFAKSDKLIIQMRILNLNGDEIIRLDSSNEVLSFKEESLLQNKKHREYFEKFIKLQKNELGYSELNLNIENNEIEKPFKPTLRLAMPIYLNEEKKGILIINYSMEEFIKKLFISSTFNMYMIDKDGYFIYHPNKKYSWSRFIEDKITIKEYFSKTQLDNLIKKELDLWGYTYKVIYENNKSATLSTFLLQGYYIGFIMIVAFLFLLAPFIYFASLYIKKIASLNNTLNDSKIKMESILNHTSDSIILIDLKGIIKEVNLSAVNTFGYGRNELVDKNINILVPEPHHSKHDEYVKNHDKNMHSKIIGIDRELFGKHKDGTYVPISLTVTKVKISDADYFIGTIKNLSSEVKTKRLFENVFESSAIGIAIVLPDGSFWKINKKFADIVEYTADELTKLTFQDITYEEDLEKDLGMIDQIFKKNIDQYNIEKRYITKSRRVVWVNLRVKAVYQDKDKEHLDYFIATVEDISEQLDTKTKLDEAEEIAHIGHWLWRIKENNLIWSKGMLELFGKTTETFTHDYDSFITTVHEDDRESINKNIEIVLSQRKEFDIEYRIVVDDKIKYIHAKGRVRYLEDEPIEFFGTCQDITKLKTLQSEKKKREMLLMEQSKLASMGEMVGAIAHQWRQPLNSIGFILQDMISAYKHNEFNEEYLKDVKVEMMEQLNYMSETIDEFRNYFKKDEPYKEFSVVDCVLDVNKLYRSQLSNHYLTLELLVEGQKVEALSKEELDKIVVVSQMAQLKQVLINCISNAKDAILELDKIEAKQKNIVVEISQNNKFVNISINDLAGGVSQENINRIFEPYFTTKNMGTGLGLYICKTICNQALKGDVFYKSIEEDGFKGSSFTISLPKS